VAPAVCLVGVVVYLPTVQAVYYSFFQWDGQVAHYVGLANYRSNIISGPGASRILLNNALLLAFIPLVLTVSFVVASALHQRRRGAGFLRSVYFFPVALSGVAIGITGTAIFGGGQYSIGNWLGGSWTALAAVAVTFGWASFGVSTIIILAGMSTIDPQVLEAGKLDGATGVRKLWFIVLPLTRRFVEFAFFLTLIAALTQQFPVIFTMTYGGPGFSTTTLEFSLYDNGFNNGEFGLAAATGVVLLLITALVTWPRIRSGARTDHYM
jgi:multiple sugar transport system permease protein